MFKLQSFDRYIDTVRKGSQVALVSADFEYDRNQCSHSFNCSLFANYAVSDILTYKRKFGMTVSIILRFKLSPMK